MPQMGYDMQEGTVVRWLKSEGSEVKNGEPIAEIETDKAVVEFESYASGVIQKILVPEGTTVPVGQPIAVVGEADELVNGAVSAPPAEAPEPAEEAPAPEEAPARTEPSAPAEAPGPVAEAPPEPPPQAAPAAPTGEVRASPVARRLAEERGIDLSLVRGTGPGGRITKDDVLGFTEPEAAPAPPPMPEPEAPPRQPEPEEAPPATAPPPEPEAPAQPEPEAPPAPEPKPETAEAEFAAFAEATAPQPEVAEPEAPAQPEPEAPPATAPQRPAARPAAPGGETVPLSRMRQQIARVTLRSKQEKPHFYVTSEIDMTEAMAYRQRINRAWESEGVRITVNDLIIKACVEALKKYPKFNAFLEEGGVRMNDQINIGIAMTVEEGLMMPAIMDCRRKSLKDIGIASKDLAERAQSGTLHPEEYTGGTFGISNLGMFDVTTFVAIIQPPQTAILAVGTVAKRPVVRDDEIVIRQTMNATISADHRVVDGVEGAQFLTEVKNVLEDPLSLVV